MNPLLTQWFTHYENKIPKTWDSLSTQELDVHTINASLVFCDEFRELTAPAKESLLLEMISSWLNTGKITHSVDADTHGSEYAEFIATHAKSLPEISGTFCIDLKNGTSSSVALISTKTKKIKNSLMVTTCRFSNNKSKINTILIPKNDFSVLSNFEADLLYKKDALGIECHTRNNITTTLEDENTLLSWLLFAAYNIHNLYIT